MNPFHRPIEERIEPYNSNLLLISTVSGSPYCHNSRKTKSVLQEVNEQVVNEWVLCCLKCYDLDTTRIFKSFLNIHLPFV